MAVDPVRKLMQRIDEVERQVRNLATTPRLANSAIQAGAITVIDDAGAVRAYLGLQPDGTYGTAPVAGPTPPVPTRAAVEPTLNGLIVSWDGEFKEGGSAPLDFAYIEIHVTVDADEDPVLIGPIAPTLKGILGTARSCQAFIPTIEPGETHYVYLLTRSTSGAFSQPSNARTGLPMTLDEMVADLLIDTSSSSRSVLDDIITP